MNPIEFKRRPKIKHRETLHSQARKIVKSLIITLALMIAILSGIFLSILNEGAQKGYALQQEKLKNEHLKTINTDLTTKITQATAFSGIEGGNKVEKMQTIEEKNYVTSEDNLVY